MSGPTPRVVVSAHVNFVNSLPLTFSSQKETIQEIMSHVRESPIGAIISYSNEPPIGAISSSPEDSSLGGVQFSTPDCLSSCENEDSVPILYHFLRRRPIFLS